MKIYLVNPSRFLKDGTIEKAKRIFFPSLTLPLLAAMTPPPHNVTIVEELVDEIPFDKPCDLAGITSYSTNIARAYEIADEFRRRKVPVVMGGFHVSAEPEEALHHADAVFIGESEETWPGFLEDFESGKVKNIYGPAKFPALDHLPVPRYSLLDTSKLAGDKGFSRYFMKPVLSVQTARGCPQNCDFCSVAKFYGRRHRPRPLPEVIHEIRILGAKIIFFVDEDIFFPPKRARELFRSLIPLDIRWIGQALISAAEDEDLVRLARRSGCLGLLIGLESLSSQSLASMGKSFNRVERFERNIKVFRRAGIELDISMMFGFDEDGPSVFRETYDFLKRNHVSYAAWWPLTPFPGTALYERLRRQGRLKDEKWWLKKASTGFELKFSPAGMDDKTFRRNFYRVYGRFYSRSNILRRFLLPPNNKSIFNILYSLFLRRTLKL